MSEFTGTLLLGEQILGSFPCSVPDPTSNREKRRTGTLVITTLRVVQADEDGSCISWPYRSIERIGLHPPSKNEAAAYLWMHGGHLIYFKETADAQHAHNLILARIVA